jgi:hypothetical protein
MVCHTRRRGLFLSPGSLALAVLSVLVVTMDIVTGRRKKMWIMNLVWPLTALWSGPLGLYGYFSVGRASVAKGARLAKTHAQASVGKRRPFWHEVALGTTHCGSGCTLGDLLAETLVIAVPLTFLGSQVFGTWLIDFALAFLLGIVFQYFTIAPMRGLGVRDGLVAAIKADAASLSAWQIGMYGWMSVALFLLFSPESLPKSEPVFWFTMQVAMAVGFLTSYPVNWWLLRSGIKEAM